MTPLVGDLPPEGAKNLCLCCDLILYSYTDHGCLLLKDILSSLVLLTVQGANGVLTGHGSLYGSYMLVISRIILLRPEYFLGICSSVSQHVGQDILPTFFDNWIDKYDVISDSRIRKLSVLALVQCLGQPQFDAHTHARFGLILNVITNGLHQFHIHGTEHLKIDYLVQFLPQDLQQNDDVALTTEPARKRELAKLDGVCTINLKEFVQTQLAALRTRLGEQRFVQLWNSSDSTITQQLQQFLTKLQETSASANF